MRHGKTKNNLAPEDSRPIVVRQTLFLNGQETRLKCNILNTAKRTF
jgi:hypothetical protein